MAHQGISRHETGTMRPKGRASHDLEECIRACTECHQICLESVETCLRMGGRHAAAEHIGQLLDCARICATAADFMMSRSNMHSRTCSVCAEVCTSCAESCRELGGDAMDRCADACERCAASCESMSQEGDSHPTKSRKH